jgi:hypothetical protein
MTKKDVSTAKWYLTTLSTLVVSLISTAIFTASCDDPPVVHTPPPLPAPRGPTLAERLERMAREAVSSPSWQALLRAARDAEIAYNHISDTPIATLQAERTETADLVTRTRDDYRKASSFRLPRLSVESSCQGERPDDDGTLDGFYLLTSGLKLTVGWVDGSSRRPIVDAVRGLNAGYCYVVDYEVTKIISSRDRIIWSISKGFISPFQEIATGDSVSINDLVASIRR